MLRVSRVRCWSILVRCQIITGTISEYPDTVLEYIEYDAMSIQGKMLEHTRFDAKNIQGTMLEYLGYDVKSFQCMMLDYLGYDIRLPRYNARVSKVRC